MTRNIGVFIGRFQPFHNGHKYVVEKALEVLDGLIIVIGSVDHPRNIRDPFTFSERLEMISRSLEKYSNKLKFLSQRNHLYNETLWANEIRENVSLHCPNDKIHLVGFSKDHTSYYLNMFPEWKSINIIPKYKINATDIRKDLFEKYRTDWSWASNIPKESFEVIKNINPKIIDNLIDEYRFIKDYKSQWSHSPYPPTFVTTDAVVVQSGHILMVTRGANPGKGLLALPGGFVGQYETIKDSCIRELCEETRIDIPKEVLYGAIKDKEIFDSPYRSLRGRTITHAFFLELNPKYSMPKVKGGDDALKAQWIPLNELRREFIYEDHGDIIEHFCGVIIK